MSDIVLHLADDVFKLDFLPSGNFPREEYEQKTPEEKLQLHEEALIKELKEQLHENFGIEASVAISEVKAANGVQVVMRDFNISVFNVEDLTETVEDTIYFHNGCKSDYEEIGIMVRDSTLTR